MDLQFYVSGETSQSWQKAKGMSYMAADKREMRTKQKGFPLIKPSDLVRLLHYHENSMGETSPMIQLSPTGSLSQHKGIMGATIQDDIWVGHSQTISPTIFCDLFKREKGKIHFSLRTPGLKWTFLMNLIRKIVLSCFLRNLAIT